MDVTAAPSSRADAAARSVALNPVSVAWSVNVALTLLAGYGLHLTSGQAGWVVVITSAVVAVVTACSARPWHIPAITGAVTSALAACAAFGLRWTPEQTTAAAAALSVVLMLVTHQSVTPVAALRKGLTATEVLLGRGGGRHVAVIAPAPRFPATGGAAIPGPGSGFTAGGASAAGTAGTGGGGSGT